MIRCVRASRCLSSGHARIERMGELLLWLRDHSPTLVPWELLLCSHSDHCVPTFSDRSPTFTSLNQLRTRFQARRDLKAPSMATISTTVGYLYINLERYRPEEYSVSLQQCRKFALHGIACETAESAFSCLRCHQTAPLSS